jgi:Kef-type K+ transport system membrane component KefB
MSPRGEVGIVVAALGLTLTNAAGQPLIGEETYAVLLAAIILTTLAAPIMLQWAIPRVPRRDSAPSLAEGG